MSELGFRCGKLWQIVAMGGICALGGKDNNVGRNEDQFLAIEQVLRIAGKQAVTNYKKKKL